MAVIAALVFIELKDVFPKGTPLRDAMKFGHFQAGLIVLLLVLPRLLWRFGNRVPDITPTLHKHGMLVARVTHWVLYTLMLALPLLGIMIVQGSGHELAFFGQPLPVLFAGDRSTAHDLKDVHETLGNVLLWLLVLHVTATVWHHRFVKDDTLTRLIGPRR